MSITSPIEAPEIAPPATQLGDHDLYTHLVPKDKLADAMVYGFAIEALCGKQWVPSRDPERYPLCPTCEAECRRLTTCSEALDAAL
jgi:hypothetical protein